MPPSDFGSYKLKVSPPTFKRPVDVPVLLREAMQLHRGGRLGEAETRYRKILTIQPKHADALHYLGLIALRARRYDTAAQFIGESVSVAPDNAQAHSNLGNALAMLHRSDEAQAAYARALALDPRLADAAFADFYLSTTPELAWSAPHCIRYAGPGERIRVGFVSRFLFGEHPIGKCYGAVIDQLDRGRFDVSEFRVATAEDSSASGRAQTLVPGDDLGSARATIAAARLDVMFYPEVGIDPATYFLAMSRLAPVQCVSLGHPVTTGIANVDYFLSDDPIEGGDFGSLHGNAHPPRRQSESSPSTYAWRRRRHARGIRPSRRSPPLRLRAEPDRDPSGIRSGARRNPASRCAGVARAVTGRQHGELKRAVDARLRRAMPGVAARVVLLQFQKGDAYLGLLQAADAVLDTPHFDCGTMGLEALGSGIPIVTWPGAYARSRRTQALYRRMQIDGPIASDAAQYVELASRLAQDPAWRNALRAQLRERSSVLREPRAVVSELEAFFSAAAAAAGTGGKVARWPQ